MPSTWQSTGVPFSPRWAALRLKHKWKVARRPCPLLAWHELNFLLQPGSVVKPRVWCFNYESSQNSHNPCLASKFLQAKAYLDSLYKYVFSLGVSQDTYKASDTFHAAMTTNTPFVLSGCRQTKLLSDASKLFGAPSCSSELGWISEHQSRNRLWKQCFLYLWTAGLTRWSSVCCFVPMLSKNLNYPLTTQFMIVSVLCLYKPKSACTVVQ